MTSVSVKFHTLKRRKLWKRVKGITKPFALCLKGHLRILWKEEFIKHHRKIDPATPKHTINTDTLDTNLDGHFELLSKSGRWNLIEIELHINAK